ncbi:MAG: hypothetical protein GX589_04100, partial [Deltaproteobacteria bacterium]|nr:hypothetical protein [Deltaproteobacteria bacterium]
VDESSYLSGSFKGSIFDGDCRISGHAVNTDFTDAIWECGTLYKLANWLDGMRFSWNTVNREYFDYIADNITVGSLAKDFERFNQRFFDENLDEYLSHLEKDRGCKKTDSVQPTSPLLIQKQIQEVVRLEIPSEPKCIVEVSKGDDLPCAGSLIIENPNTPGNFKDVYPNGFDHRAEAVDAILDVLSQKKSYRLPAPLNTDTQSESQQSVSEEDELAQKQTQLNQLLRNLERRTPAKKDEAGRVRR